MRKKDAESIFQCYRLITEGIKDIQQNLLQYKDEDWYDDAYNTLSIRNKEAAQLARRADLLAVVPQSWTTNEGDKPLFTDNDARHCVKWVAAGTSINDILTKYVDYKRYNMQQLFPLTQFNNAIQFSEAVDQELQNRVSTAKTKAANTAAKWEPEDIIFENDDIVILNGHDRYANIRIRAVLTAKTGLKYTFCISNPTLLANLYDSYRFKPGGTSQFFYWLFFKNIPREDRFHICVLGVRKDGTYDWSLADNHTADVPWDTIVKSYNKYGVNLNAPLKGYNGQVISNVKAFLKYNELTPAEQRDKDFRDMAETKLKRDYNTGFYDVKNMIKVLQEYTTEYSRKLLSDALDVTFINADIWEVLTDYSRNCIVNRMPAQFLNEDVVTSPVFLSNTKIVSRYTEILSRSVLYVPNHLLNIMTPNQIEKQTLALWQHKRDVGFEALNLPMHYASHFEPAFLARYLSKAAVESEFVKRPENWPNITREKREKLFHYMNDSVNKHTNVDRNVAHQALEIFVNLDHLGG